MQRQRLDEDYILRCFSGLCEAVAAMHNCDPPIIHRDLKVRARVYSRVSLWRLIAGSRDIH